MADADARENWTMMLAFRDRLTAARSVEAAYLDLVRGGLNGTPPIFLNQLAHLILRNALDGCDDPTPFEPASSSSGRSASPSSTALPCWPMPR